MELLIALTKKQLLQAILDTMTPEEQAELLTDLMNSLPVSVLTETAKTVNFRYIAEVAGRREQQANP